MRPRALGLIAGLAIAASGCDRVFGLARDDAGMTGDDSADAPPAMDLDGDGIADAVDDCIASIADGTGNYDGDSLVNQDDVCPFDGSFDGDPDTDGIPTVCDPADQTPGDHSRCVTVFADPALTAKLWRPRGTAATFAPGASSLVATPSSNATTIAAESLEGVTSTTYEIDGVFDAHAMDGSFTLWMRANPDVPDTADLGCRFRRSTGTEGLVVIGPDGNTDLAPLPSILGANRIRMRGTITTTSTSTQVRCFVKLNNQSAMLVTTSHVYPLPAGRVGFSADHWDMTIKGLHIFDHP